MSRARDLADFASDSQINAGEIEDNAVTTTKIADSNVTNAKLANSTIIVSGDSGSDSVALGETLTIAGGTGIDTTGNSNTVTLGIDSTVATLTGTQTLTNKTIDTANNTITIVEADISDLGSYITASSTDTLTNKSGNISQWTNDAGYLTSETDSQTLSFSSPNLTISNGNSVDISAITSGYLQNVSEDTTPQLGGNLDLNSNNITGTGNINITGTATVSGDLTVDTNTLYVDSTNNEVGIGTATPNTDVWSGARTLVIKEDSGDGGITLIASSTSNNSNIGFTDNTNAGFSDLKGLITYLHADDAFRINVNGSERLRIGTSELVINDTSNDYDFRVESNNNANMLKVDGGTNTVSIGTSNTDEILNIDTGGAITTVQILSNTESSLLFNDKGGSPAKYKVGTNISGNTSNFEIYDVLDSRLITTFDGDGNVGIGTSSPSTALEVAGTIKSTVTDNSYGLWLESTDADAVAGPRLLLSRNSSTPADGDSLGQIVFNGTNDNYPEGHVYARIDSKIQDASNATEDGVLDFLTSVATSEGTSRIYIDSTGVTINDESIDSDFRVESDTNTHALFVDGGNNRVGIKTSSPSYDFHVTGTGLTYAGGDNALATFTAGSDMRHFVKIQNTHGNSGASASMAGFDIDVRNHSNSGVARSFMVLRQITSGGGGGDTNISVPKNIIFKVNNVSAVTASTGEMASSSTIEGTEAFQIDSGGNSIFNETSQDQDFRVESNGNTHALFVQGSDGNVGIGTSSPQTELHVSGAGNVVTFNRSGVGTILFGLDTAKNEIFSRDGGTGNFPLAFFTGTTERMRITSDGKVGIGTSSPTNTLDVTATSGGLGSIGVSGGGGGAVDTRFYIDNVGNGGSGRGVGMSFRPSGSSNSVEAVKLIGYQQTAASTANNAKFAIQVANSSGTLTERVSINNTGVFNITGSLTVNGSAVGGLTRKFFGYGVNSASNASGWRVINFGTEVDDDDSRFTHTSGTYTVGESGTFLFVAGHHHTNGTHNDYQIRFHSNVHGWLAGTGTGNSDMIAISMFHDATLNEVIDVRVYHNNTAHNDAGGRHSFFGGYLVK